MVPLFYPAIFKDEWLKELANTYSTRWIGQGPKVDLFEEKFAEHFGFKKECCVAVSSGTAALELAYELAGIGKGTQVMTPVLTCTATNLPLIRRGAQLLWLDVDEHLCPSNESVKHYLGDHVRYPEALVLVNLGGIPCHPELKYTYKSGIPLIVDACQSLGEVNEVDRAAHFLCYSFQAIKHFTTGDGGMLICKNPLHAHKARLLRWFGIDRAKKAAADWKPWVGREMTIDIDMPGYKYQMTDVAASMGLVGLRHSDELLMHRKAIAKIYMDILAEECRVIAGGSCWTVGIITPYRDQVAAKLASRGVETNNVHLRNDIFKVFGGKRMHLPNMNKVEEQYLYLPIHPQVEEHTAKEIALMVAEEIRKNRCFVV